MKSLPKEQQESYENAKICYIFTEKFIDHCHYTGKYEGAVGRICNLKYNEPKNFLYSFS